MKIFFEEKLNEFENFVYCSLEQLMHVELPQTSNSGELIDKLNGLITLRDSFGKKIIIKKSLFKSNTSLFDNLKELLL